MRLQQWRVLKLRKFNYLGENIKGLHLLCSFQSEKGKTKQQQQNPHKKQKPQRNFNQVLDPSFILRLSLPSSHLFRPFLSSESVKVNAGLKHST